MWVGIILVTILVVFLLHEMYYGVKGGRVDGTYLAYSIIGVLVLFLLWEFVRGFKGG